MPEKTAEQVLVTTGVDGLLFKSQPSGWEAKVRQMRRDATIGFVRDLYMAPILISEWTVVSDAPKYKNAEQRLYDAFVPKKRHFMRAALRGLLDFGWQAYEKVWGFDKDGYVCLKKLKPLLQDITHILVKPGGDFNGVRNFPMYITGVGQYRRGPWVDLDENESLLLYDDVEGTNWYGEPKMRRAERAYDSWVACDDAANRFDKKIAGAHWVIYYPVGVTPYNGVSTDNFEIARAMLNALEANGRIVVPIKMQQQIDDLNQGIDESKSSWKIELISANTTSAATFVDRQNYLDKLKVRALGFPERAVLEGEFGTKAEAEAHADFAIDSMEMGHQDIIELLNQGAVNQFLELNHGEHYRNHVKITAMPLSDWKRDQLKELYVKYLENPEGFAEESMRIDWDAIRDKLDVPMKREQSKVPTPAPAPAPAVEQPTATSLSSRRARYRATLNGHHLHNGQRLLFGPLLRNIT